MDIYKINDNLNITQKISLLNDMILGLEGLTEQGKFDINELDQLYSNLTLSREFKRNIGIGNLISTYTGWTHLKAESGYSIWKYTPTNYNYNSLNNLYLDNKVLNNKGKAVIESSYSFDKVYLYDGDLVNYNDITTEASSEGGTPFNLMEKINDYLYLGYSSIFKGIKLELNTRGSDYNLKVEYYKTGSGWTQLTLIDNELVDNTSNFESDGRISWNTLLDWETISLFSGDDSKYYIRISTTTEPVTIAKANYLIPGDSVISLLALSSVEILHEEWGWCSFDNNIYVTIRNTGNPSYEGNFYITSTSSDTNKRNFFVYIHQFTADYEDITYTIGGILQLDKGSLDITKDIEIPGNSMVFFGGGNNPDGQSQIIVPHHSDFNLTNIAIEILFIYAGCGKFYPTLLIKGKSLWYPTPEEINYKINLIGNKIEFYWYNGGWKGITSATSITIGDLIHLVVTYDGSDIRMWINGEEDGNSPKAEATGMITNSYPLIFGSPYDMGSPFNGWIDEIKFFNRALDETEVGELYNGGNYNFTNDPFGDDSNIARFAFNEGSGTTTTDSINGHIGTLTNIQWATDYTKKVTINGNLDIRGSLLDALSFKDLGDWGATLIKVQAKTVLSYYSAENQLNLGSSDLDKVKVEASWFYLKYGYPVNEISKDTTLGTSDDKLSTQNAIKTYVDNKFINLQSTGTTRVGCPDSPVADIDLSDSQVHFWVDETSESQKLMFKIKLSSGVIKSGEVDLT